MCSPRGNPSGRFARFRLPPRCRPHPRTNRSRKPRRMLAPRSPSVLRNPHPTRARGSRRVPRRAGRSPGAVRGGLAALGIARSVPAANLVADRLALVPIAFPATIRLGASRVTRPALDLAIGSLGALEVVTPAEANPTPTLPVALTLLTTLVVPTFCNFAVDIEDAFELRAVAPATSATTPSGVGCERRQEHQAQTDLQTLACHDSSSLRATKTVKIRPRLTGEPNIQNDDSKTQRRENHPQST